MKKTLLLIGLLSYGSGMYASGLLSAAKSLFSDTPERGRKKAPMADAEQQLLFAEIQAILGGPLGLGGLFEALKDSAHVRYYELPYLDLVIVTKPDGSSVKFGDFLRAETNAGNADARAIYETYMFRGGMSKLEGLLRDAENSDLGLEMLAQFVESCPVLFEKISLFAGALGDRIEVLCAADNKYAKAIRAAYTDDLWAKNKSWPNDKDTLTKKSDLKAELAIFEKRSGDPRLSTYRDDLKTRLQADALPKANTILAGTYLSAIGDLVAYLERIVKVGIDFDAENIATLVGKLKGRNAEEQILKTCLESKKWVLSPEAAAVLKKYRNDPRCAQYVDKIKAELPLQLATILGKKSRAKGIDRLNTWLSALADAGVEFDGAENVAAYQAQLKKKKDELPPVTPVVKKDPAKPTKPTEQSWLTPGKIVVGLGAAALVYALYNKLQSTEENNDAKTARVR